MTRRLPFAAVVLLVACAQQPNVPSMQSTAAKALVNIADGGELVEVERHPDYSIIEVPSSPKGSVPSSMFALRGSCAVTRARGESHFASTPLAGPVRAYRLTFPKAPTETELKGSKKSVFSLAECNLLRF